MAALSYAVPVLDLRTAVRVSSSVLFLWPLVLVAIVSTVRWKRLKNRFSFIVLGYFVCLGVQAIARTFGYTFSWVKYVGAAPPDRILIALTDASLSVAVVAVILSIAPVIWLALVCTRDDDGRTP